MILNWITPSKATVYAQVVVSPHTHSWVRLPGFDALRHASNNTLFVPPFFNYCGNIIIDILCNYNEQTIEWGREEKEMENTVSLSFQYNFSVIFQIINPFWTFFFFHLSNFPRQMGIGIKKLMGMGSQTVCPSPVKMPRKTCNYSHSQFKHSCPTEIT